MCRDGIKCIETSLRVSQGYILEFKNLAKYSICYNMPLAK